MGRSEEARARREQERRTRVLPNGMVRWTVDLTEDQAAALIEAAGEQEPGPAMRDFALLHTGNGALVEIGLASLGVVEQDPRGSELAGLVIRDVEGGRWIVSRGFGGHEVSLPGSFDSRESAFRAGTARLDAARRLAGLPILNEIPVRFPERGERARHVEPVMMVRPPDGAIPATTARQRRQARRHGGESEGT